MKNLFLRSMSISKILITLTLVNILYLGNAFSSGTLYLDQDFDNPSFPPSGWELSNTSGYNFIRTTYASSNGLGTASAVADFYDYASGGFNLTTPTLPPATSGDSLIFDHAYASGSNEVDKLEIFTSADNGATWIL